MYAGNALKTLWFYSACWLSTKTNERVNDFQRTCDSRYVYQNELN